MFRTLPARVSVYEVSPRDGLQNEPRPVSLEGKVALVTGTGPNIGSGLALMISGHIPMGPPSWGELHPRPWIEDPLHRFAYESHQRAARATDEGRFENEIVPIEGLTHDEGVSGRR